MKLSMVLALLLGIGSLSQAEVLTFKASFQPALSSPVKGINLNNGHDYDEAIKSLQEFYANGELPPAGSYEGTFSGRCYDLYDKTGPFAGFMTFQRVVQQPDADHGPIILPKTVEKILYGYLPGSYPNIYDDGGTVVLSKIRDFSEENFPNFSEIEVKDDALVTRSNGNAIFPTEISLRKHGDYLINEIFYRGEDTDSVKKDTMTFICYYFKKIN